MLAIIENLILYPQGIVERKEIRVINIWKEKIIIWNKENIKKKQVEVLGMENYNSQSKEHNKCDK